MVVHTFRPRIQKAEGGDLSDFKASLDTVWVPRHSQGYTEKPCQKNKQKKNLFLFQYFLLKIVTLLRSVFSPPKKEKQVIECHQLTELASEWGRTLSKVGRDGLMCSLPPITQSSGGSRWQGHHQQGLSRSWTKYNSGNSMQGEPKLRKQVLNLKIDCYILDLWVRWKLLYKCYYSLIGIVICMRSQDLG